MIIIAMILGACGDRDAPPASSPSGEPVEPARVPAHTNAGYVTHLLLTEFLVFSIEVPTEIGPLHVISAVPTERLQRKLIGVPSNMVSILACNRPEFDTESQTGPPVACVWATSSILVDEAPRWPDLRFAPDAECEIGGVLTIHRYVAPCLDNLVPQKGCTWYGGLLDVSINSARAVPFEESVRMFDYSRTHRNAMPLPIFRLPGFSESARIALPDVRVEIPVQGKFQYF